MVVNATMGCLDLNNSLTALFPILYFQMQASHKANGVQMNVEEGDPHQVLWGQFAFFVALSTIITIKRSA